MTSLSLPKLCLDGKKLEFVGSWKHLGHIRCYDVGKSLPIESEMKRCLSLFNLVYHHIKGATPVVLCRSLQALHLCFVEVSCGVALTVNFEKYKSPGTML